MSNSFTLRTAPDQVVSVAVCPDCNGTRRMVEDCSGCYGSGEAECTVCDGKGYRDVRRGSYDFEEVECPRCNGDKYSRCRDCYGRGTYSSSCSTCSGRGHLSRDDLAEIEKKRAEEETQRRIAAEVAKVREEVASKDAVLALAKAENAKLNADKAKLQRDLEAAKNVRTEVPNVYTTSTKPTSSGTFSDKVEEWLFYGMVGLVVLAAMFGIPAYLQERADKERAAEQKRKHDWNVRHRQELLAEQKRKHDWNVRHRQKMRSPGTVTLIIKDPHTANLKKQN